MLNIHGNCIYSVLSPTAKENSDWDENLLKHKSKGSEASPNNIIVSNHKLI